MKKTGAAILLVTLLTAAPVMGIVVHVPIYSPVIYGNDSFPGASIMVRLYDKNGQIKVWENLTADPSGDWGVYFPAAVRVMPGDSLDVWENINSYSISDIPKIEISKINVGKDVVTGFVKPKRNGMLVHVEGERLSLAGWDDIEFEKAVNTRADGSFRGDLTSEGNIKRMDNVMAGYVDGVFVVYQWAIAPGLMTSKGSNFIMMGGFKGGNYRVQLLEKSGALLAESYTHAGEVFGPGAGMAEFTKPGGYPVKIKKGHRIKVIGRWGFTDRVDPLSLTVNHLADTFYVKAKPNAILDLELEGVSVYRQADGSGDLVFNWLTEMGTPINFGDECSVVYQDRQGNQMGVSKEAF
jgi:hypothetical protein